MPSSPHPGAQTQAQAHSGYPRCGSWGSKSSGAAPSLHRPAGEGPAPGSPCSAQAGVAHRGTIWTVKQGTSRDSTFTRLVKAVSQKFHLRSNMRGQPEQSFCV